MLNHAHQGARENGSLECTAQGIAYVDSSGNGPPGKHIALHLGALWAMWGFWIRSFEALNVLLTRSPVVLQLHDWVAYYRSLLEEGSLANKLAQRREEGIIVARELVDGALGIEFLYDVQI